MTPNDPDMPAPEPGDMAAGTPPNSPAATPSTVPAGNEEAPPNTAPLQPSDPPAGEDTSGGAGAEPMVPPEQTPPTPTEPPPIPAARTQVFLLFGQSNMYGVPAPQAQDLEIHPRVEVLTLSACGRHGVNQWMPAQPPLHGCVGQPPGGQFGPGLGPGDYFGKALAAAFPEDTILLVPNAIPGASIDVFLPGQEAYNSILARAQMAQQRGEIRGILFHQGETNCGDPQWPGRVDDVVTRLRSDLGIGEVPFLAGEMLYANQGGQCGNMMNPVIAMLPAIVSNSFIVSAEGLGLSPDQYNVHFNLQGQREFGRRYADVMLGALGF